MEKFKIGDELANEQAVLGLAVFLLTRRENFNRYKNWRFLLAFRYLVENFARMDGQMDAVQLVKNHAFCSPVGLSIPECWAFWDEIDEILSVGIPSVPACVHQYEYFCEFLYLCSWDYCNESEREWLATLK